MTDSELFNEYKTLLTTALSSTGRPIQDDTATQLVDLINALIVAGHPGSTVGKYISELVTRIYDDAYAKAIKDAQEAILSRHVTEEFLKIVNGGKDEKEKNTE